MNFQYSYRAFLVTSLLTGILVLSLYSLKLKGHRLQDSEEIYDVVLAPDESIPEKNDLTALVQEKIKIETNKAYNEAEKHISSVEDEDRKISETTEGKLQEMKKALDNSQSDAKKGESWDMAKAERNKSAAFSNSESNHDRHAVVKGGNPNTTISYRLRNRQDLALPNPVYTCSGSGKVVINITVDALGKVTKISYNKSASTTSNACLIDAALEYSTEARFTTDASRVTQLGTITFNFPGQH